MDSMEAWLRLYLTPGFGSAAISAIQQHYCFDEFFSLSADDLRQAGFKEPQVQSLVFPDLRLIERLLDWHQQPGQSIVTPDSPCWPVQLSEISSAPVLLFVRGNKALLSKRQIAMVGSRRITPQGAENAFEFARNIALRDWVVTSGLALGVDGESHKGALSVAPNRTIAVLGTGVDHIYPRRHASLAESILVDGAIVSEFLPGTPAKAEHFPRRNRIISGLSSGTLVVEAAVKSGSLITARYALEQNREVFAIPGSLRNDQARGCHYLIKQGAKLVESVDDIFDELNIFDEIGLYNKETHDTKNPVEDLATDPLSDNVDYEVTPVDLVVQRSALPVDVVLTRLLDLEMQGVVAAVPGGYIKLRRG